ncbi:c-type cytochrome [Limobrevibacterium gyesilva]|uniref:Cytochrome c domain-containing protein n=1 Tax=Limobrevibacterium gyesilva TaxID=2991712 RepID=A0AA41YIU7_9PROT|nr:hypothetical protein [Limobrevibacterium gyesilva]MCW3473919.1 hypothetical protein [Limobrevibacterium gyesilva]
MIRWRVVLLLAACAAAASVGARAEEPPLGATNCSGCHATTNASLTSVPPIVGRNADELVKILEAYRSGELPATVMDRLMKGFSHDEIRAIAIWYAGRQ